MLIKEQLRVAFTRQRGREGFVQSSRRGRARSCEVRAYCCVHTKLNSAVAGRRRRAGTTRRCRRRTTRRWRCGRRRAPRARTKRTRSCTPRWRARGAPRRPAAPRRCVIFLPINLYHRNGGLSLTLNLPISGMQSICCTCWMHRVLVPPSQAVLISTRGAPQRRLVGAQEAAEKLTLDRVVEDARRRREAEEARAAREAAEGAPFLCSRGDGVRDILHTAASACDGPGRCCCIPSLKVSTESGAGMCILLLVSTSRDMPQQDGQCASAQHALQHPTP